MCSPKRDSDHPADLACFEEGPQPTEPLKEDKSVTEAAPVNLTQDHEGHSEGAAGSELNE